MISLDPSHGGVFKKLSSKLLGARRARRLEARVESWRADLGELGVRLPSDFRGDELLRWQEAADEIEDLVGVQHLQREQERDTARLSSNGSLEDLSKLEIELSEQIEDASENLWRLWLVRQPARLAPDQRRRVGEYASTLRALREQSRESRRRVSAFDKKCAELLPQISEVLPCWAVTSLSVHRRVPLHPGFFDLVVIDEASQCDIASIVPLLYRARRAVIIGDPQQLRHISALRQDQNGRLLEKHRLAGEHMIWDYVNSSFYDLGAPMAAAGDVVDLREHHRSHPDIIEFSNQTFYEGKLRVATRYGKLRSTRGEAAVRWMQVSGRVERGAPGGSRNREEAEAVVRELRRLLVEQTYDGTVGVISPFRAQANLIRERVTSDPDLAPLIPASELLVDTVHRFQGDERDVMIFSPVVGEGIREGSLHFLRRSPNLFNVAITRARSALIVIGDKAAAESCGVDYLAAFARYVTDLSVTEERKISSAEVGGPEYPSVARPELVSDWERRFYTRMYESGLRPIPQYDVEKYTLDFALIDGERRLDIEVDGEHHRDWTGDLCRRDIMRNQRMMELGWDVLRFWVYELDSDMDGCVKKIREWESDSVRGFGGGPART
ncbi:MAG: AAA domain-containing protein [bacterium]